MITDIALNKDMDIEFSNNDLVTTNSLELALYNALTANIDLELICHNKEGSTVPYMINQNRISTKYLQDLKSEIITAFDFLNDIKDIKDYSVDKLHVINSDLFLFVTINFTNRESITYKFKI